jgi:hypothetical protein
MKPYFRSDRFVTQSLVANTDVWPTELCPEDRPHRKFSVEYALGRSMLVSYASVRCVMTVGI